MDVVTHSVCNIFKRLLVVWLLHSCTDKSTSWSHVLGLFLAGVGFFIYISPKLSKSSTVSLSQGIKAVAAVVMSVCLLLAGMRQSQCGKRLDFGLNVNYVPVPSRLRSDNDFLMRKMAAVNMDINEGSPPNTVDEFVSWSNLLQHPTQTDFLTHELTTNQEIVSEAQRVLLNLLSNAIGSARHVMLMEIATYENKGDPAITVGEVMLLRKLNKTVVYYCETHKCTENNLDYSLQIDKQYDTNDLVILMQGGGNLVGYEWNDQIRNSVIKRYPHRKLVLLSQSIWINSRNHAHLQECVKIYSNRQNLIMFLRDRQSLAIARQYFPGTETVLAPDMAFGIGALPRLLPPSHDIIWLHRDDHESSKYQFPNIPEDIVVHISDYVDDWVSNKGSTDMETSFLIANAGLEFLQRGRVVITDRLHGHILSTLLGIPHILIDNPPYHKLSSFRKSWTHSLNNTVLVTTGDEALSEARRLLNIHSGSLPSIAAFMKAPSVDPNNLVWISSYNSINFIVPFCIFFVMIFFIIIKLKRRVVNHAFKIGPLP